MGRTLCTALLVLLSAGATPAQDPQDRARARAEALGDFGREFARRVETGDLRWLEPKLDTEAVLDRCFHTLSTTSALGRDVFDGFRTGVREHNAWVSQIVASTDGGSYDYLGIVTRGQEQRLLFRMIKADGSFNFHEYTVGNRRKTPHFVDIFPYASGELLSETLRRLFVMGNFDRDRSLLGALIGDGQSDLEKHIDDLRRMNELVGSDPRQVLAIFDTLPESLQREKMFLLIRIQAASFLGVEGPEYAKALDDFAAWIPEDDASRNIVLIDAYFARGQFDELLRVLRNLRSQVGREGWLPTLMCVAMMGKNDHTRAREYAEEAVAAEPDLFEAHANRVVAALAEGQEEHILEAFRGCDAVGFALDDDWLAEVDGYADFLHTPAGKTWRNGEPSDVWHATPR